MTFRANISLSTLMWEAWLLLKDFIAADRDCLQEFGPETSNTIVITP